MIYKDIIIIINNNNNFLKFDVSETQEFSIFPHFAQKETNSAAWVASCLVGCWAIAAAVLI